MTSTSDIKVHGDGCTSSRIASAPGLFKFTCDSSSAKQQRFALTDADNIKTGIKPTKLVAPDSAMYCVLAAFENKIVDDACVPCPPHHYCDGTYSYLISGTNDITLTPNQRLINGTVNMYQVQNKCAISIIICIIYYITLL